MASSRGQCRPSPARVKDGGRPGVLPVVAGAMDGLVAEAGSALLPALHLPCLPQHFYRAGKGRDGTGRPPPPPVLPLCAVAAPRPPSLGRCGSVQLPCCCWHTPLAASEPRVFLMGSVFKGFKTRQVRNMHEDHTIQYCRLIRGSSVECAVLKVL